MTRGQHPILYQLHELWKDIWWRNKLEKKCGEERIAAKKAEIAQSLIAIRSDLATEEQEEA